MTPAEAVRAAAEKLGAAGVATPALDARLLALEAFGLTLTELVRGGDAEATPDGRARLDALAERRAAGEPVDRILGRREFWGLTFALTSATLAPRPDTETIVETALAEAGAGAADRSISVLDLGTGAGCLLLAILAERAGAHGLGVDRSPEAAAAAQRNAGTLGFGGRARFVVSDWAAAIAGTFDLVVSNPPYIATPDLATLDPEVRLHDPRLALDGGTDGLDAYRAILGDARRLLAPGGALVLELGAGQQDAVTAIAAQAGLELARAVRDLGGVPRAAAFRRVDDVRPCDR